MVIRNKGDFIIFAALLSCVLISSFSAAMSPDLDVSKRVINDVVISEINTPAIFSLKITNNGPADYFSIYSLVGVDIKPETEFFMNKGEEKEILIEVYPRSAIKKETGPLVFIYKIKSKNSGIYEDALTVNVVKLQDAFEIGAYAIEPESQFATVYFKNIFNAEYQNVKAKFSSVFFEFEKEFSVEPLETKEFEITLKREDVAKLTAGQYIIKAELTFDGITEDIEGVIRFNERAFIKTETEKAGFAIVKTIITKSNQGNMPTIVDVAVKKNIFSKFFTSFNVEPYKSDWTGLAVYYYWQKELQPGSSFVVKVTTNNLYPILIIIAIVIIVFLIKAYKRTYLIVRKSVHFVKTKGDVFALKISLRVTAKSPISKISVYDRVPAVAKLYERYGMITPEKYDEKNRRLQWRIESLGDGEERVFSYIIYSKVGLIGKFELPRATAVYEKDDKIHEAESNRAYILTKSAKED